MTGSSCCMNVSFLVRICVCSSRCICFILIFIFHKCFRFFERIFSTLCQLILRKWEPLNSQTLLRLRGLCARRSLSLRKFDQRFRSYQEFLMEFEDITQSRLKPKLKNRPRSVCFFKEIIMTFTVTVKAGK